MSAIEPLFRHPLAQAVAWALLHFVWQGALVALLTAAALAALRRGAADIRYVVATIGLAVMLTVPIVTAAQIWRQAVVSSHTPSAAVASILASAPARTSMPASAPVVSPIPAIGAVATPLAAPPAWSAALASRAQPLLPGLMLAWAMGVLFLTLRLAAGWIWIQRTRSSGSPARPEWQALASRLSRRLHVRRAVALLESTAIDVPTVIGWLTPVVLLPASALAGLAPGQLEAILAHELAHVRRQDYLVNLLQTLVETLLFYHPGVWWLSRRIRTERENCCDDLAVRLCGDPVAYASALADLETARRAPATPASRRGREMAMAATGGSLLQRVRRVLGGPSPHGGRGPAWLAGCTAVVLLCGIAAGADGMPRAAKTAQAPAPTIAPSPAAVHPLTSPEPPPAAPVDPPPPAAAVATAQSVAESRHGSSGTWVWSNDGEKLTVKYDGEFDFTDDDADVQSMSPGASLQISDGALLGRHTVQIRNTGGTIERRYWVNGVETPFDPAGRAWLQAHLPSFVRNTGIDADRRVARILKSGGPTAVLAEISRIDSSFVKRLYFTQLFAQASLDPATARQSLAQAGREIRSDFDLASLLISVAGKLPGGEASRAAYFDAARGIHSDFELHRVYAAMLSRGPVGQATLAGILGNASGIQSDFELSRLLQQIAAQQALDATTRPLFFRAADTIGSSFERHRVLRAVATRADQDDATLAAALQSAAGIDSDFEASAFLRELLEHHAVTPAIRTPFFQVVDRIGSAFERGRVLRDVGQRPEADHDVLLAVLRSAKGVEGAFERSRVLTTVASAHAMTGDLRDAYLDAANTLTGFEQGRVMTALVRSERR
ncbi:MAG TPA: M56 family metallopeptidase [Vicinamibacterales bacterium]|nr:M56 family metallopeptidase [Vicinamibacterales bacterium]